jgi:biotin carboxyl carrier protein
VTRREIFYFVSLACLGIFILVAAYMWGESRAQSKIMASDQESISQQSETTKPQNNSVKAQSASTANTAAAQKTSSDQKAESTPTASANTGTVQNQTSSTAPAAVVKNNYFVGQGSKVGDIVKIGDIEMIVTKSTARYKVIDITLKGNTAEQPPRLVLADNNRIVYEIPADVDVNMDVTEKTVTSKSPLF